MADLLIPLLLVFAVVGGVLVWALVRQLRELDEGSDRPFGSWREGGPDPVPPWRLRRGEKQDRPSSGQARRQPPPDRPTLPWQRREQQPQPARPRPTPAAPAPPPTRPEPAPQSARSEPAPQSARSEPAPRPVRPERTPQPARPALPWQRGGEEAERGRPRRPRQPAWLTLPGQRRSKDAPRERPADSRPDRKLRGEGQASPDRPAPLWQRPRGEAAHEPPAPAGPSGRCATCGGTGQAIVSRSGGGLGRGPCPVCQGS